MMRLEDYGYNVTSMARSRHSALGKAVKALGYEKVRNRLYARKNSTGKEYRENRLRADIHWLNERK